MRKRKSQDAVGYRKPPKRTRFRRGKSGNPTGRPPGSKNLDKALMAALHERVPITINGRRKNISKLEAAFTQLSNQAAKGDLKAIQTVFREVLQKMQDESPGASPEIFEASSHGLVMADIVRRMRLQEEPVSGPDEVKGGESAPSSKPKRKKT